MGRWLRAATVSAVVVATALVVLVATATAGTTQVSGPSMYADCTPPASAGTAPSDTGDYPVLNLDGSLDGCWYTYISEAKGNPSGTYQEKGTELFVGCLDGTTCGQFTTTYTFTGKFAGTAAAPVEIHGRCQHAVTGTTGGFVGMTGVIQFKDDVDTGIAYYRGNLNL
jgi:hypothetical protein